MMNMVFGMMKLALLVVVILITSQIPVGNKRVCDHVGEFVKSGAVQQPIHWVAEKFDFVQGNGGYGSTVRKEHRKKAGLIRSQITNEADPDHGTIESERSTLSGFLKKQ